MTTKTPSICSIDIIPNETLTLVVAYLPYTRRLHDDLRLVNKRFRNVVDSSAFLLEVARRQFPDQSALLGLRTIDSREQVEDLARYEVQLARTVQVYANSKAKTSSKAAMRSLPPSKTTKHFLSNGLRLLDYIVSVYQGSESWKFPVLLGRGVLDPGCCLLLRVTIGRLYNYVTAMSDHLNSHESQHLISLRNCGVPGIQAPMDQVLDLARRRNFERAVLCLDWSSLPEALCQPSFALLDESMREVVLAEYANEYRKLASSLVCATPIGELLSVMDPSARDDKLLEALEWRILSRDIDLSDPAFADTRDDTSTDELLTAEFMHQRMCNVLDEDADNDGHQASSISEVHWSEVGESIRKCAEEVQLSIEMGNLMSS